VEKPLRDSNHFWPVWFQNHSQKALGQIDKEELERGKKAAGSNASQRQINQRAFNANLAPHMEDLAILHRGNKARALQRNEWNRRCQTPIVCLKTSDSVSIPTCLSTSVSFEVVEEMVKLLWSHGQQGINVKYVVLITPFEDMPPLA
jgi:hypothetical protein